MEVSADALFAHIGFLYVQNQELTKQVQQLSQALADKAEAKGYVDVTTKEEE